MDYLQKIRSTVAAQVHSVAAQVNLVLPGNPIFREYSVGQQIASAGPGLCWKIYMATKNSTKQEVAVWLFEKKQAENWQKIKREELPEMLKRGVSQLTRLRHPRIVTVERALEESRDCFAFCTEPVFASLANCFGDHDNIMPTPPAHLKNFELHNVEIRHGLLQISEALAFLHNDAKTIHGNISPASVIINSKGAWKLGGFDFCITASMTTPGKVSFSVPIWSQNSISALCPDLDYVSPELADGFKCDLMADIYSMGVLAFATFNKGKPLFGSQNSFTCYRKSFEDLKNSISSLLLTVPEEIREDIKMCLNETPEPRPNAIQLTKIQYFKHPLVLTLNLLDTRSAMDNTQKIQFYKGLPAILSQYPLRTQLQKVYPHLAAEYSTPMLVPFILSSVFMIAENANADEFSTTIMPSLVTIFPIQTPYQIQLILLQNIKLLLNKMPTDAIKQHLLPLIYASLTNESPKIQAICLSELPNVVKYMDREQMQTQLLPKLIRMLLESKELTIRVQTLVCLSKLLPILETWMVADQLLPALAKINSKDPGVLMAVLGIYKMIFENEKFGINKEQCARSVLPYLISISIEPTLNLSQFSQFMDLVHKLLQKMENDQQQCLSQLSARQEEERQITDFTNTLNGQQPSFKNIEIDNSPTSIEVDLGDLAFIISGNSAKTKITDKNINTSPVQNQSGNKVSLTLDDKKHMATEREKRQSMAINGKDGQKQQWPSFSQSITPSQQQLSANETTTTAVANKTFDSLLINASTTTSYQPKDQQNQLDFLSEFLPTTGTSSFSKAIANDSTAFPTIPLPTSSANPIQRRTGTTTSNAININDNLFDQLLLMDLKTGQQQVFPSPNANGNVPSTTTNSGTICRKPHSEDPLGDLLR